MFEKLITEVTLARLAGEKSFARGAGYFESGAVVDLVQTRDAISARVLGSDEYRVELRPDRDVLAASCTCPVGEEGEFCKHAVAAGLAWLGRGEEGGDDLAEYAMRRGIAAYENIDDSGGGLGETLRQIAALHLEACRAALDNGRSYAARGILPARGR